MASLKEVTQLIHYKNLLHSSLRQKKLEERWNTTEKLELARNVREAWEKSMWEGRQNKTLDFNDIVIQSKYKDGEPNAIKKRNFLTASKKIDMIANLENPDDVRALRAYLDENGNPQSTLATRYFPFGRGDRSAGRYEDDIFIGNEIILLRRELRDLSINNIRRFITSNSHSPALAFFLLEAGIPVVDVISLPGMFDFSLKRGIINKNKIYIPVTGDDGAGAMGELIEKLAGENNIESENSIHAKKTKTGNKTEIYIDPEQLKRVKGKTAIIPEDILATGGTLEETTKKLIKAGVTEVIIMVSYPIFANSALEKFKNNSKIKIITTDGFSPQVNIENQKNIFVMSTKKIFAGVLELDRQGVNFFMPQGKDELKKLGFCLNPWMDV